jgi:hypothetical protein
MRLVAACLVAIVLGASAHAESDDDKQLRDYVRAGNGFYRLGDYANALRQYAAGYERLRHPAFLVNMAQCYRQMHDRARACETFKQWQRAAPEADPLREQVATMVASLGCAELRPKVVALPPPPPQSAAPASVVVAEPPARHPGLRKAGIALVAVGGAGAILGATFIGLGVAADRTIANPPPGWVYDPALDGRRSTLFPAGVVLGVVGVASAVAGGVILVRTR